MTKITIALSLANKEDYGYLVEQEHKLYLVQADSKKGALGALELTLRADSKNWEAGFTRHDMEVKIIGLSSGADEETVLQIQKLVEAL